MKKHILSFTALAMTAAMALSGCAYYGLPTDTVTAEPEAVLEDTDTVLPELTAEQKGATHITADINSGWYKLLDFDDKREFDNATKGLLKSVDGPLEIKNDEGNIVWSVDPAMFEGDAPDTANPSLWRDTQLNAYNGLFEVCDGIYQVRGYDMANLTLIRTDNGYMVYDTTMVEETAKAAMELAESVLGEIKVTAVLSSHSHIDHYGGIGGIVTKEELGDPSMSVEEQIAAGKIPFIVPAGFAEEAIKENVYVGSSMGRRAQYQYGTLLPQGETGRLAMGIGMGQSLGNTSYFAPTYEVSSDETINIDGVEAQFMLTPGTEAPAEMNTYFPDYKALWMAENCTGTLHNLYTLRGAQVRDGLAWSDYIVEAYNRFGDEAEVVFCAHNWPHWGDEIEDYMLNTAEIYKFIHDETAYYINQGYTENEIADMITLPADLEKVWYTRQYYGTVKHDAKAVYQRYMGWYTANPVDLDPLPEEESAKKYVEYLGLGGTDAVIAKAKEDYDKGEYQWVAQIMKELIFADPSNQAARNLCADALEQLGYQAESGTWRNAYLTGALELRTGNQAATGQTAGGLKNTVAEWTVRMMFDNVAVSSDCNSAEGDDLHFNLVVTDLDEKYHVRRVDGVIMLIDGEEDDAQATVTTTKGGLALALLQGDFSNVTFEGDDSVLERLLAYRAIFTRDFNIIEP